MADLANNPAKKRDKHRSIVALLTAHQGESDPKALIRRLAREKVAYAKAQRWSGPPFCPRIFSSIFDLKCKEVEHDIGGEGRILPDRDGKLYIEYRGGRMVERQRFTIFHEFAHTLFPDFCEFLPAHDSPTTVLEENKEFEHLCDLAASEMLFPQEDFTDDLNARNWLGIEAVHQLRQRYQASIDATVYRMLALVEQIPLAAVFLTDQRGQNLGRGPLWVKSFTGNSLFKGYIRSGTTPPFSSVAVSCLHQNLATSHPQKETWWINGKPRSWLFQAARLPSIADAPDYPKVVALIFPSSYHPPI